MSSSIIEIKNINVSYGSNHVLKDVNLNIENKDFYTFLGPSGCGKTTLLRLVAGFEKSSSGELFIDGKEVSNLNPWERQAFQREQILKNINQAKEDDLILFSDPDEIPNLSNFKKIEFKKKYIIFLQDLFYYKLNIKEVGFGNNWEGTRGCLKKNLKSIDYMRQKVLKKNLKYGFWRIDKERNLQILKNGGWHFSYLLTPIEIKRKILSK